MRAFTSDERRARLGVRHHLAGSARALDPVTVTRSLVALHGTDAATVFLSVAARTRDPDTAALERALYEDRSLVRMLGMRRTMFVVPREAASVIQRACTDDIALQQRKLMLRILQAADVSDDLPAWLADVERSTLAALEARGEATAQDLARDEPRLATRILLAEGKSYAGSQSVSTRMLLLLSAEGKVIRTRPRGTWISSQHRWAPLDAWLGGPLADVPAAEAQAALVQRWLRAFGPAPLDDVRWWTGLTVGQVRRALSSCEAVEVSVDGAQGYALADDLDETPAPEDWIALLPALDPTVMGWSKRDWFLGPHSAALFDRNGNAGPSVWWNGRIVGGWAQRTAGDVVFRLLEEIPSEAVRAIESEAARLQTWLGPIRITPRFRTPLEKELSAT
jgi:Winged helix DNA-binding domain